jgi:hypothetical protein
VVASSDGRALVADWYDWGGSCDAADYGAAPATVALAGTSLTSLTPNTSRDLVLQNPARVSRTGASRLCLQISGGQPAGGVCLVNAAKPHHLVNAETEARWCGGARLAELPDHRPGDRPVDGGGMPTVSACSDYTDLTGHLTGWLETGGGCNVASRVAQLYETRFACAP